MINISIKKVFKNITIFSIITSVWLALLIFLSFTQKSSFSIDRALQMELELISTIKNADINDLKMSQIKVEGKLQELKFNLEKLHELLSSDILGDILIASNGDIYDNYNQLHDLYLKFSTSTKEYFFTEDLQNRERQKSQMLNDSSLMIDQINKLIKINFNKTEEKFKVQEYLIYFAFLLSVTLLIWYSNRLNLIYRDIQYLFSIKDNNNYTISTNEVNSISKRMSIKSDTKDDLSLIDATTDIKNMQGVLSTHADSKISKNISSQIMALFSIDDISILREKYPTKIINTLLKKVAFVISLHEQHSDIIGYVGDNSFLFIFNQKNKKEALDLCEEIRDTIEKSNFKIDQDREISITISCVMVTKIAGKSLENSISQAKEYMSEIQLDGKNRVRFIK